MPAVPLPWTEVGHLGVTAAAEVAGDPVNGHTVRNDGSVEVIVRNASSSTPATVTFTYATPVDGQTLPPLAVVVPASTTMKFFGFAVPLFGPALAVAVSSSSLRLSAEHKAAFTAINATSAAPPVLIAPGDLVVTNNGDGTYTLSGPAVIDNGDGTYTIVSASVVDNGDGTYSLPA